MWILIIILISPSGNYTEIKDIYFDTQQKCEEAKVKIYADLKLNRKTIVCAHK